MRHANKARLSIVMVFLMLFIQTPIVFANAGVPSYIEISGLNTIGGEFVVSIPAGTEPNIFHFTADVFDSLDNKITSAPHNGVVWSALGDIMTGISVNPVTGVVSIENTAEPCVFNLIATSSTTGSVFWDAVITVEEPLYNIRIQDNGVTLALAKASAINVLNEFVVERYDQKGILQTSPLPDLTWSISPAKAGVTISDSSRGIVTISSRVSQPTMTEGTFNIFVTDGISMSDTRAVPLQYEAPSRIEIENTAGDVSDNYLIKEYPYNTNEYTAKIYNQLDQLMLDEAVTWSTPSAGVYVNDSTTGVMTITSDAMEGIASLRANSITNPLIVMVKAVTLEFQEAQSTTVSGADSITIPTGGNPVYSSFSASSIDQEGTVLTDLIYTYSIQGGAPTGVSIHPTTGILSLTHQASPGSIIILASRETTEGTVTGSKTVTIVSSGQLGLITIQNPGTIFHYSNKINEVPVSAVVLDIFGTPLPNPNVIWSIENGTGESNHTGITFNNITKKISIAPSTTARSFKIAASYNGLNDKLELPLVLEMMSSIRFVKPVEYIFLPKLTDFSIDLDAGVLNQAGEVMEAELIDWDIRDESDNILDDAEGFSINASGLLTVRRDTVIPRIKVTASSQYAPLIKTSVLFDIVKQNFNITVSGTSNITIPLSSSTIIDYSATVSDQQQANINQPIIWSLVSSKSGVTINSSTGQLTVDSAATPGTITITAAMANDAAASITKTVTLLANMSPVASSINITGQGTIQANNTSFYVAAVKDQYNSVMGGEAVSWSLQTPKNGVTINASSGLLTVTSSASAGTVNIIATSVSNPSVFEVKTVTITTEAVANNVAVSVSIAGQDSVIVGNTSAYTATARNVFNAVLSNETFTWRLQSPKAGVAINSATGLLSVANNAAAGSVTIVVTPNSDNAVSSTKIVTIAEATPTVTSISIFGNNSININSSYTFTAAVKDQYNNVMNTQAVIWSLQAPKAGVSINATTGQLIVNNTATTGQVNIVATSAANSAVTATKTVNITGPSTVNSIVITGQNTVNINTSSTYTATVKDQSNNDMTGQTVTWSLQASKAGVTINPTTGVLTVSNTATAGSVTIIATSTANTAVTSVKAVTISTQTPVVTSIVITGQNTANINTSSTYTAVVKDQNNNDMTGQTVTWSLQASKAGVTINSTTGVLTVSNTATAGSVTIIATSTANSAVVAAKTISVGTQASAISSIVIIGENSVTINSMTAYYALVKDQNNSEMTGQTVSWSLQAAKAGVSINSASGALTISSTATPGTVTIVARSTNNTAITAIKTITIMSVTRIGIAGGGTHSNNAAVIPIGASGNLSTSFVIKAYAGQTEISGVNLGSIILKQNVPGVSLVKTATANEYNLVATGITTDTVVVLLAVSAISASITYELTVLLDVDNSSSTNQFVITTGFNQTKLTADQTLTATSTVKNNSNADTSVLLVVVLYDEDNQVKSFTLQSKVIKAAQFDTLSAGFKLPDNVTNCKVKAFIWEGSNIQNATRILSNVVELSI